MGTALSAHIDLYAGDTDWLVKLSDMYGGINHADAGAVTTRPVGGTDYYEAGFVQHANSLTVPVMQKTSRLVTLQEHDTGMVIVINRDAGVWWGGNYTRPSDDRSLATAGRLTYNTVFGPGGDWYDGAPSGILTRARRVALSESNLQVPNLALAPETDTVFLVLETSADCTVHIGQGGNRTADVDLAPGARIVNMGSLSALGSAQFNNGSLSGNGITGNEQVTGWLLAGPVQGVD